MATGCGGSGTASSSSSTAEVWTPSIHFFVSSDAPTPHPGGAGRVGSDEAESGSWMCFSWYITECTVLLRWEGRERSSSRAEGDEEEYLCGKNDVNLPHMFAKYFNCSIEKDKSIF